MGPNATARANHERLFPGHVSTLALTDPELIEVFDNVAFDEVLGGSALDGRTRLIGYPRTLNALRMLDEAAPSAAAAGPTREVPA